MRIKTVHSKWSLILIPFLFCIDVDANFRSKPINDKGYCADARNIPVCASNGTDNIIYPNKCLLKEAFKTQKDLKRILLGDCLNDCNLVCFNDFKTICAINPDNNLKRTFKNICELIRGSCRARNNWKFYKNGPCPEAIVQKSNRQRRSTNEKRRTPIPCPKIFSPVCATLSGVKSTFINECLVNAENVKYDQEWAVLSKGVCAEDYSYYSPRLHKSKRNLSQYPFSNFDDSLSFGDDVVHIRAPTIFQTQILNHETRKIFGNSVADADGFNYQQVPQRKEKYFPQQDFVYKNFYNNYVNDGAFQQTVSPTRNPLMTFGHQQSSYNYFDPSLNNIIENLGRKNFNSIDISQCQLGKTPLCCNFQGNKRTFQNICALNLHNEDTGQDWQISYEGSCNDCSLNCTKAFDPICATRKGLNYTIRNECLLKFAMCRDKLNEWKILKKGICDDAELRIVKDKYESKPHGFKFVSKFKAPQDEEESPTETSTPAQDISTTKVTRPSDASTPTTSSPSPRTNSSKFINAIVPEQSKTKLDKIIPKDVFDARALEDTRPNMRSIFDLVIKNLPFILSLPEIHETIEGEPSIANRNTSSTHAVLVIKPTKSSIVKETFNSVESLPDNITPENEDKHTK